MNQICQELKQLLLDEEIKVEYDDSKEKIRKKVRRSNIMKNPYTLIIGDNERDNNLVSYRKYGSEETDSMNTDEFIKFIKEEIKKRQKKDNQVIDT